MKVSELMSFPVHVCHPEESLARAADLMFEHDCAAIPVVDNAFALVGMITDRDVCRAAAAEDRPLDARSVDEDMTTNVAWCAASDEVLEAGRIMRDHGVRRLPVLAEDGSVIGIVSLSDLARVALDHDRATEISPEIVDTIFVAVARPHRP